MKKWIIALSFLIPHLAEAQVFIPFLKDTLFGFVNVAGDTVIAPAYEDAEFFYDGWAKVKVKGGFNWINQQAKFLLEKPVNTAGNFSEGLAFGKNDGEPGFFVNTQGQKEIYLAPNILVAEPFSHGTSVVSVDTMVTTVTYFDHWNEEVNKKKSKGSYIPGFQSGVINRSGNFIVSAGYDDIGKPTNDGYFRLIKGNLMGMADTTGKIVIPVTWEFLGEMSNGLVVFRKGDKYGYLDHTGKKVIKAMFSNAGDFNEDLAPAMQDSLWGFIDKKGRWVIKPQYLWAESFYEGLAGVVVNRKWGFIDHTGFLVFPAKFDDYQPFQEGYAAVRMNGLWGFLYRKGGMVIQPAYEIVGSFVDGITRAEDKGVVYYIRTDGGTIVSYRQRVRFKGK